MDLLGRLNTEGTTVVMVTHNLALRRYADRVLRIRDGRLCEEARPDVRCGLLVWALPVGRLGSGLRCRTLGLGRALGPGRTLG